MKAAGKRRPAPTEIARRAYQIFLGRGANDEHDVEDWLQAEAELAGKRNQCPGSEIRWKFMGLGGRAPAALMPALGGPAEVVTYRPIGSSFRHPCLGTGRRGRDFLNELPIRDTRPVPRPC
jgi:DUF2934 family protein